MPVQAFWQEATLVVLAITAGVVNVALFLHILASKRLGKKIVKDVNESKTSTVQPNNKEE